MDYKDQAMVAFVMVIILTAFQLITTIALIILWTTFRQLKKDLTTYKDSLPLVNITNLPSNFTLPVPSISQPDTSNPGISPSTSSNPSSSLSPNLITSGSIVGQKQQPEKDEIIEIVPTPDPERKLQNSSTVAIVTNTNSRSTVKERGFSFTSFTEFSRDSGIGSSSDRNQSTSSESMKYSIGNSSQSNPVFPERAHIQEETRTQSNASRESNTSSTSSAGDKRISFHDFQNALHSAVHYDENAEANDANIDDDNDDDDYKHLERLQTMAIEMIDIEKTKISAKEKRKRLSQILNDQEDDQISFVNRGYSDASVTSQPRAPLASEECSLASDALNAVDENANDVFEEEVYENQEVIDKHRMSVKMQTITR